MLAPIFGCILVATAGFTLYYRACRRGCCVARLGRSRHNRKSNQIKPASHSSHSSPPPKRGSQWLTAIAHLGMRPARASSVWQTALNGGEQGAEGTVDILLIG